MVGTLVAEVRERRGWSQAQLAAASGIDQPNISAIENGRRIPTAETLAALLESCGYELGAVGPDGAITAPPMVEPAAPPPALTADERRRAMIAVLEVAEATIRSSAG